MRVALAILVVVLILATRNAALAAPTAYYNPADGSIRLRNDTGFSLWAVSLSSPSDKFTGIPLLIPGTNPYFAELPEHLTYFFVPPMTSNPATWGNVGAVVPGGGPLAALDLSGIYLASVSSIAQPLNWIEIPEPTSALLGGFSIAALVAVSRRRTCSAV